MNIEDNGMESLENDININDIDDIKITTVKVDSINIRDGKKDFKLNNRLLKNKTKYI